MNEITLHRPNQDRIVIHPQPQGWQVTYYHATPIRGSWFRRLFAAPPLFRAIVHTQTEVHSLLISKGINLSRAENQRLNSILNNHQRANLGQVRRST